MTDLTLSFAQQNRNVIRKTEETSKEIQREADELKDMITDERKRANDRLS